MKKLNKIIRNRNFHFYKLEALNIGCWSGIIFLSKKMEGDYMSEPYFRDEKFPNTQKEYVLWIDIMGTKNFMSTSLRTSSLFICKLHMAILDARTENMHIYPVMDGAYITTNNQKAMKKFIREVFTSLGELFIGEENPLHKFIVKGAIAYGPVVHGKDIPRDCNDEIIGNNREYMTSILLGMPMIQAVKGEKYAPPFGIYCDESVRMEEKNFSFRWYNWLSTKECRKKLLEALIGYFNYCENHSYKLDYDVNKIREHRKKSEEYFED